MSRGRHVILGVSSRVIGMHVDNIRESYGAKAQIIAQ